MSVLLEAGPFSARDGEGRVLFDAVEVRLEESTAVVLGGPSGSGKSTLFRHLAALETCPEARRDVAGVGAARGPIAAWRARVTLMAQDAPMLPGTVRDNLDFPYRLRSANRPGPEEGEVRDLLARVGLADLPLVRDVTRLSGGERHRLALVRGLLWDPVVLLADEPLAGLDPDIAAVCFDELLGFARRPGHALLMALHDPGLARRADRLFRLRDGRLETVP